MCSHKSSIDLVHNDIIIKTHNDYSLVLPIGYIMIYKK